MIITALLLAGAVDAEEAGLSRASGISLAPACGAYQPAGLGSAESSMR